MRLALYIAILGLNVLVPVLVRALEFEQALFSYIFIPALIGLLVPLIFRKWHCALQVLSLALVIFVGAVLRPLFDGIRAGWDFSFDNEPEVEFLAAIFQFAAAGTAFLISTFFLAWRRILHCLMPSVGRAPINDRTA